MSNSFRPPTGRRRSVSYIIVQKSTLDANDTAILYKPCCGGGRTLEQFARAGLREHYQL